MERVKILFDMQKEPSLWAALRLSKKPVGRPFPIERGGVYVALGFSGAQAQEKQFRPSGNRPENPQISAALFSFHEKPQIFMERVSILF